MGKADVAEANANLKSKNFEISKMKKSKMRIDERWWNSRNDNREYMMENDKWENDNL